MSDIISFTNLIKNARELRKLNFLETHYKLVKEIMFKFFDDATTSECRLFAVHLADVLRRTHDEELIDFIVKNYKDYFMSLDLSPKFKSKYLKDKDVSIDDYKIGKHLISDFYDNPTVIIHKLISEGAFSEISKNVEYSLLFANYNVDRSDKQTYLKYINKYFKDIGLRGISDMSFNEGNVLKTIAFEDSKSIQAPSKVSIIVSAFNSENTIAYALESLLNQSYQNLEILVCDDCSTDSTLKVAQNIATKDRRVKVFKSLDNQGTYNIRNALIEKAVGEFITFHDSDDISHPSRIELQVKEFLNDNIKACYTNLLRLDCFGNIVFFFSGIARRLCGVSMMMRRSEHLKLPRYRSSLVSADTEQLKILQQTYGEDQIIILNKPLVFALWSEGSLTNQKGLLVDNKGYFAKKRRVYAEITAQQRLFGKDVVSDNDIVRVLKGCGVYKARSRVVRC